MFVGHLKKILKSGFVILIVFGCQTKQNSPPEIFAADAYEPLMINARKMKIINSWDMPVKDPFVGHRANPLPSVAIGDWATHVLRPAGGSGEILFEIKRASIVMSALPVSVGLDGLFNDQQSDKITAEIEARLIWLQPVGGGRAMASIKASHSITTAESASSNIVSAAIHAALQGAIARLDGEARRELQKVKKIVLP
tara:strand:+ start:377 stop:967 length:591 start_codon:yes stop_codon:yes gene_type:complete